MWAYHVKSAMMMATEACDGWHNAYDLAMTMQDAVPLSREWITALAALCYSMTVLACDQLGPLRDAIACSGLMRKYFRIWLTPEGVPQIIYGAGGAKKFPVKDPRTATLGSLVACLAMDPHIDTALDPYTKAEEISALVRQGQPWMTNHVTRLSEDALDACTGYHLILKERGNLLLKFDERSVPGWNGYSQWVKRLKAMDPRSESFLAVMRFLAPTPFDQFNYVSNKRTLLALTGDVVTG